MAKDQSKSPQKPNYITPQGFQKVREEYNQLLKIERPELVKVIEWAASNGDRSENADYIYGKRRLREIDKRLYFLQKRLESAEIIDGFEQTNRDKIFFGATVKLEDEEGNEFSYHIVGEDEIDTPSGKISWVSPLGKALLGKCLDDEVTVKRPAGPKTFTIIEIDYKLTKN